MALGVSLSQSNAAGGGRSRLGVNMLTLTIISLAVVVPVAVLTWQSAQVTVRSMLNVDVNLIQSLLKPGR